MKIYQTIINWWEHTDSEYKEAVNELKTAGFVNISSFVSLGILTIGFVLFKFYFFNVLNARETIDILLNETLWLFTVLFVLVISAIHHFVRAIPILGSITKFLTKHSFNYFMGLVFILIAGFSVRAFSIPFLDTTNPLVFVAFVETIFFLCLSFWLKVILPPNTPNKSKLLKYLLGVAVISFIIMLVCNFNS